MTAPTLSGFGPTVSFRRAEAAAPQLLDAEVSFGAGASLDGGVLTVSGLLAEDRVAIRHRGTGAGELGVAGASLSYGGVAVGTFTGGLGSTLSVTFNAAAGPEAVEAVIESLTYASVASPPTASRTLLLDLVDSRGGRLNAPLLPDFVQRAEAESPFRSIDVGLNSAPEFLDLDGDGDLDLAIGASDGTVRSFARQADGSFVEMAGAANPFAGIDVGSDATLAFADLDGDGAAEALLGELLGDLRLFRRNGTGFTEVPGDENPFSAIEISYRSAPSFVDLDGDGDLDLVVGEQEGRLLAFRQGVDGAFVALEGTDNPFHGVDVGDLSSPSFVDLDGDGDLDGVIGANDGRLTTLRREQDGRFTLLPPEANPLAGIDVGHASAPAFADLDGDGDLDMAAGENAGVPLAFENRTAAGAPITVLVTQDGPVASNLTQSKAYTEGAAGVALDDIVVDVAGGDASITARLLLEHPEAGSLSTSGSATYDPASGLWTITAPLAEVNAALATVAFVPAPDNDRDTTVATHVSDAAGLGPDDGVITLRVTAVNDAPVLTPASPTFATISAAGTVSSRSVGSLLAGQVSDVDTGALRGIAVTEAVGSGIWRYSRDDGATWTNFGAVTASQARLLLPTDLLQFVPDARSGAPAFLAFRAWDRTSGVAGGIAEAAGGGGSSSFSAAADRAQIVWSENLAGSSGPDTLIGGPGSDTLSGLGGDDVLSGGPPSASAPNRLWGGDGSDTASYESESAAVQVDLRAQSGRVAGNLVDLMSSVENAIGGSGPDVLIGADGANRLNGGEGRDALYGLGGDDVLIGGPSAGGANQLWGAEGSDTASYEGTADPVHVDLRAQWGRVAGAVVDLMNSIENAAGGPGADVLIGTDAPNVLSGRDGRDALYGLGGDDVLAGGLSSGGANQLWGGAGSDTAAYDGRLTPVQADLRSGSARSGGALVDLMSSIENLTGGVAGDHLIGDDLPNVLAGGAGDDVLAGGSASGGTNRLLGGDGLDAASYEGVTAAVQVDLRAQAGRSGGILVDVMASIENVIGGDGSDILIGANASNSLRGGAGHDALYGLDGDDILQGGPGNDQLWGGAGSDTADYSEQRVGVTVHLGNRTGSGAEAGRDSFSLIENVRGGAGSDTLHGSAESNVIEGGGSRDLLYGQAGADRFLYVLAADSRLPSGYDLIGDFESGVDKLDLSAFRITAAQVLIASGSSSTSLYADTDPATAGYELAIAFLGASALTTADILF